VNITEEFKNCFSYENVGVNVTTEDRTYSKHTSLQERLSSLIGIVKDANINALVNLDCFATMVPLQAEEMLREIG